MYVDGRINVLIAESQTLYAEVLSWHLSQYGYFVRRAENFEQMHDQLLNNQFDILILDINLYGMYGTPSVKLLHSSFPIVPKMILAPSLTHRMINNLMQAGASACISKSVEVKNFPAIVELVCSGETYVNYDWSVNAEEDYLEQDNIRDLELTDSHASLLEERAKKHNPNNTTVMHKIYSYITKRLIT